MRRCIQRNRMSVRNNPLVRGVVATECRVEVFGEFRKVIQKCVANHDERNF